MQQFLVRMQSLEMNNIILQKNKNERTSKSPEIASKRLFYKKKLVMNMHQTEIGSRTRICIGFSFLDIYHDSREE